MFGTLAGSMLPFILGRLGFDPAASSAPFVATLVDVTGLCIYFLVALVILRAPCYEWKMEVLVCIYPVLVASYRHGGSCVGGTGDAYAVRADRTQRELRQSL